MSATAVTLGVQSGHRSALRGRSLGELELEGRRILYRFCTAGLLLRLLAASATLSNQQVTMFEKPVKFVVRIHAGEPSHGINNLQVVPAAPSRSVQLIDALIKAG